MVGSIIGAGVQALGSIFGGLAASKRMRKTQKAIEAQQQRNLNWYNRRYNEDATQRADAQSLLNQTREALMRGNRAVAGTAAVMGGTEEAVAAEKAANAEAMAQTAAQIAANGERRKDAVEAQYMENDMNLQDRLNEMQTGRAQQIGVAAQGVATAGANLAANWPRKDEDTKAVTGGEVKA